MPKKKISLLSALSKGGVRHEISFPIEPENQSLLVAEAFGIESDWIKKIADITLPSFLNLPGITLITGESGCGKSCLLRNIAPLSEFKDTKIPLHRWATSDEESLRLLNSVGLNDASLFLLRYHELSDSQQARARMYYWLCQKQKTIVVDEFLSTLDRETAKALAFSFQKMLRRENVRLIAATAHNDVESYLQPDLVIRGTAFPSDWKVEWPIKVADFYPFDVRIQQEQEKSNNDTPGGTVRDKNGDIVGTVAKCVKAYGRGNYEKKKKSGEWIVSISPGKDVYKKNRLGELHYKGKYVGGTQEFISAKIGDRIVGWLVGAKQRTGNFRIARVVVHPTYRSCGIGQRLVRFYLNLRPDVDTVAAMARFNPVFQKAGMKRVKDVELSPPSFLKKLPLTPLQWANKQSCRNVLNTPAYLKIVLDNADKLGTDIHPGGEKPKDMRDYFKNHLDAAATSVWRHRPKKMAKYVGPQHPLYKENALEPIETNECRVTTGVGENILNTGKRNSKTNSSASRTKTTISRSS
jgi:ABC-type lipoprotein export system ATPase subunit/GNAT superfamily N-acetyltransferase